MKFVPFLTAALLLIGCGSKPVPQQTQQQAQPPQQTSPAAGQPPVVAAQQPYPATAEGSAARPMPEPAPASAPAEAAPEQAPAQRPEIAIRSGTVIRVRLNQELDTRRNRAGDRFTASLAAPVEEDGRVVLPRGTVFSGHVTSAKPSGRLKGRAVLGVTLDSFQVNGARYPIVTSSTGRTSARHKKRNLVLIGGGSGLGALIGGLAGGGKGALIGAGAGAGAGTAGAALTGKKEISLPAETLLTFRLEETVEL